MQTTALPLVSPSPGSGVDPLASSEAAATSIVDSSLLSTTLSFILSFVPPLKTGSISLSSQRPLAIGINGLQGAGKTTLVAALAHLLRTQHNLRVVVVSIDDFYLTRKDQASLAAAHPGNELIRFRGEPGTHDVKLLRKTLEALVNLDARCFSGEKEGENTAKSEVRIPRYNKSAFSGLGDRLPLDKWDIVLRDQVDVILLEGWCVGFRPLRPEVLAARQAEPNRTLSRHSLASLIFVNDALRDYTFVVDELLDAFVHLDAEELEWVYAWRLQQEHALWARKGSGMTDDQVEKFVDAYYPAYELYCAGVREGVFGPTRRGRQLRAIVNRERRLQQSIII